MPNAALDLAQLTNDGWIRRILNTVEVPVEAVTVTRRSSCSNEIIELFLRDGRVLLVKRGVHEWAAACFNTFTRAARLIHRHTDLIAPRPLALRPRSGDPPALAYWRIPLPTLDELWPQLSHAQREQALHSVGRMLRRLHAVRTPGWGALHARPAPDLRSHIVHDLRDRLLPAVYAIWPAGARALEQLIARLHHITARADTARAALTHTDLHFSNLLCRVDCGRAECVGLLDLDGAAGGVPENDVASLEVLHGPLFEREIEPRLMQYVRAGYGRVLDDRCVEFFRCMHLANQGFTSALLDHHEHAAAVAAELRARVERLPCTAGARRPAGVQRRRGTGSTAAACTRSPSSTWISTTP